MAGIRQSTPSAFVYVVFSSSSSAAAKNLQPYGLVSELNYMSRPS
jgi:hypothetical protein